MSGVALKGPSHVGCQVLEELIQRSERMLGCQSMPHQAACKVCMSGHTSAISPLPAPASSKT
jgi:hypothetical protein